MLDLLRGEELKEKDTLTEQEINLVKRRLNDGTYTISEVNEMLGGDGKKLTTEQQEKGRKWLMDKWKSPTGKERKDNPFGYREQEVLEKFEGIRLYSFYDAGRGDFHNYIPYYSVDGDDSAFEYYADYKGVHILG